MAEYIQRMGMLDDAIRSDPNVQRIVEREWRKVAARLKHDRPLKPPRPINTATPPHACAAEPCPTCDLYMWLRGEAEPRPWTDHRPSWRKRLFG